MHCLFRKHWLNEIYRSSKYGHTWSCNIEKLYSIESPASSSVNIGKLSSSWWLAINFISCLLNMTDLFFSFSRIFKNNVNHLSKKMSSSSYNSDAFLCDNYSIILPQWVGVLMYTFHFNTGNIKNMNWTIKM